MKLTPLQFTLLLATPVIVSVLFAIAALIFAVRMHVFAFPPRAIDETKLKPAAVSPSPSLPLSLSLTSFHAAAAANGTHRPRSCAVPTTVVPAARGFTFAARAAFNLRAVAHTGAGVQPRERGPEQTLLPAGVLRASVSSFRRHGIRVLHTPKPAGRHDLLCALRGPRSVPSVAKIETHV